MSFSAEVRAEMGRQGISPSTLAKRSGVSESTISRKISNEMRALRADEMEAVSAALGVPSWELMRRAEEQQTQPETERSAA